MSNKNLTSIITSFISLFISFSVYAGGPKDGEAFKACYATPQGTTELCTKARNAEAFKACYATPKGTTEICAN